MCYKVSKQITIKRHIKLVKLFADILKVACDKQHIIKTLV